MNQHAASPPGPFAEPAGVYVHWPFCARKCPYCDFFTFGREHRAFESVGASGVYLRALLADIRSARERFARAAPELPFPARVDAIYLGGGTPSLIEPGDLAAILAAIRETFDVAPDAETTLEANPTASETARLGAARELGANRVSVGCQSFDDRFLKTLGRDHDAAGARRALREIRAIGFDNVSIDLMFALPEQTLDDLSRDLDEALSFEPEHVSAYGLTYHEGTPFRRWRDENRLRPAPPEREADQYERLLDALEGAGLRRYEISNWARPGRESRHNSKYWRTCDVVAFGASAHGVVRGRRYANPRDLAAYVRGAGEAPPAFEPRPETPRAALGEILMLALRRADGGRWREIDDWAGAIAPGTTEPARTFYAREIAELTRAGLLVADETGLALTRRGLLLADSAMERFF